MFGFCFPDEHYHPDNHHAFPADPSDGHLFQTGKFAISDGNLGHAFLHWYGVGNVKYSLNKMQRWKLPGFVRNDIKMNRELIELFLIQFVVLCFDNLLNNL